MPANEDPLTWLRATCGAFELDVAAIYKRDGDHDWPLTATDAVDLERKLDAGGHFLALPSEPAALANVLEVALVDGGLMLRGVGFELRVKAEGWHRELWNWLFWLGSFLASFAQGLMLGRYITGFASGFGRLFAIVVAGRVCGGYVLLGATWLVLKTEGALQKKALGWARWGLLWVALGVALVSMVTPLASETVRPSGFPSRTSFLSVAAAHRHVARRAFCLEKAWVKATGNPSPTRLPSTCWLSPGSPTACSRTS